MGIIRAAQESIRGMLADQWLEVVEPGDLSEGVIFTKGVLTRKTEKSSNQKGSTDIISDGSLIHVPENVCMLLVDGGKVVAMSAEAGYFKVDNSVSPSIFTGNIFHSALDMVKDSFNRVKFGGETPYKQKVFYVNLQEIRNIKFGTVTPLMYHDAIYDLDLEIRTHGDYSIKVKDPIRFYLEAISKSQDKLTTDNFNEQYQSEFMEALQTSISNLSVNGVRISHVPSKGSELSEHMSNVLDKKWEEVRGIEIVSVGINAITYTEDSKEILKERNKGAVLSDPNVRQGYVQGAMARGFEAAGSNESGTGNTFLGMGIGMNTAGGMFGEISKANQEQIQQQNAQSANNMNQNPTAYTNNNQTTEMWKCQNCGSDNTGNFCFNCGEKKPERTTGAFCSNCGFKFEGETPKFCPNCGNQVR